jgi:hypothetical protein
VADEALRAAERARAAAPLDPEVMARWIAAHLRSGGRDPRRDPREGDEVETGRWQPADYPPRRRVTGLGQAAGAHYAIGMRGPVVHWREVDGMGHGTNTLAAWQAWAADGTILRVAR